MCSSKCAQIETLEAFRLHIFLSISCVCLLFFASLFICFLFFAYIFFSTVKVYHTITPTDRKTNLQTYDFMRNSMTKPTPRNYRVFVPLFTPFICICLLLLILTSLLFAIVFFSPEKREIKL